MPEVPLAGEDHRQPPLIGRGNRLGIAYRAARLNDRAHAGLGENVDSVAERENASEAAKEPAVGAVAFMIATLAASTRLI